MWRYRGKQIYRLIIQELVMPDTSTFTTKLKPKLSLKYVCVHYGCVGALLEWMYLFLGSYTAVCSHQALLQTFRTKRSFSLQINDNFSNLKHFPP